MGRCCRTRQSGTALWISVAASMIGGAAVLFVDAEASAKAAEPRTQETTSGEAEVAQDAARPEWHRLQIQSFDEIVELVRTQHFDPTYGGVDWDAAATKWRARAEAATKPDEARAAISGLIAELGQSHFALIPSTVYEQAGDLEGGGEVPFGATIRVVDGAPTVVQIRPGSAAEAAGVRLGWRLVSIGGREIAPALERIAAESGVTREETMIAMMLESALSGGAGQEVQAGFEDASGGAHDVTAVLGEAVDPRVTFGNLPPIPVRFESRRLPSGVGYIMFSAFFDPGRVIVGVREAVEAFADAPGIIIDMRGNIGGLLPMIPGTLGFFSDEREPLGEIVSREATIPIVANPRPNAFRGRVAVLIDECSVSSAEILSASLKEAVGARIFGTRTAGLVLPSRVIDLPSGDRLQYAFASYETTGGLVLEGNGLEPDVPAPHTVVSLAENRDAALDAAVRWLTSPAGE